MENYFTPKRNINYENNKECIFFSSFLLLLTSSSCETDDIIETGG